MRKYFLILLLLVSAAGFSQTTPNIIYGKEVVIQTRDTSSAELTIKNSTRNVLGYFKNIGGGKGQYVIIPQNDITGLPDSLLARYTKAQADSRFKTINYVPAWIEITDKPANFSTTHALSNDIQDSLLNKVSRDGSYANPSWITSLDYSKLTGTVPTWNQNTTGNATTATTASNSILWNNLAIALSTYSSGTVPSALIYNSSNSRVEFATWDQYKTFLGLGTASTLTQGQIPFGESPIASSINLNANSIFKAGFHTGFNASNTPGSDFGFISIPVFNGNAESYRYNLQIGSNLNNRPVFRTTTIDGSGIWYEFISTYNYTDFIVPKTGGSFTGSISGTSNNFSSTSTSSGFIKSGSSDSYFLLGGGGHVLTSNYLTSISGTMITTALGYTPENLANKGVVNGYADLDATGKIPASRIDFGQTGQTFVVSSQAAMLAVSGANVGALAVRTDESKNYRLIAQPASTLSNWQVLLSPDAPVQSVNGFTGNVNLLTTHISEGSNYWWTAARSRAAQSLTTSGSSGAATYDNTTGILNIPTYTLSGLGGQPALSGTGFVKISGTSISYDNSTYITSETDPTIYAWAKATTKPTYSWGEISGTIPTWNQNTTGNAATVTNGVYTTGSYANPSWITSLDYSKLTGTIPTWNQNTTGNAATVTNGVYTTGSYANPSWITSLDYSKLTGTVPTWNQNTTGNATTATTASNSILWNNLAIALATYSSGTVPSALIYNSSNSRVEFATWDQYKTFLGLGTASTLTQGQIPFGESPIASSINLNANSIFKAGFHTGFNASNTPGGDFGFISIPLFNGNAESYRYNLQIGSNLNNRPVFRTTTIDGSGIWYEFISTYNYTDFIVPKTGGSFTGSISGTSNNFSSTSTSSGFIKSGSSDSYFLLGGGGHVLTSNYATASDLSLYVNMTGNQYEIAGEKTFLSNIATNGKMTAARILGSTASYTTTATISSTITTAFCSGNSYTLTLPSASGVTGQILTVISNSNLTGITLSGVEGGSYTLICNSSLVLVSNGTTWKIASSYQNSGACS